MPYARMRDGAPLHYLDVGRGPVCMLLHGFGMPASLWLPFVAPLATRHRFILPNLRGFGGSHRLALSNACLLTQHADDVADLVEQLALDDFHLGGLSMGACTALQYNRLHGFGRVRAYLHLDQSPCVRNGPDWEHGLLGPQQAQRLGAWRSLMMDLAPLRGLPFRQLPRPLRRQLWLALGEFLGFAFHTRPWLLVGRLARFELLIRRVAPVANWPIYVDCLRSYLEDNDYDWRPSLPRIQVPMTVGVGMRSRMYPAAGQLRIREYVPHARIERFEDTGHAIPFEAPRQFLRVLREFLQAEARPHRARQAAA
jgi:non-heme chloroperoxidase